METLYAKVNEDNVVENIIVATPEFISTLNDGYTYIQTYPDANGEASKLFNLASKGGKFSATDNAFIGKSPFPSWTLDTKFQWQPPIPYPSDGKSYDWDESKLDWLEILSVSE